MCERKDHNYDFGWGVFTTTQCEWQAHSIEFLFWQ
jgi:hypothetical protein